MPQLYGWLQMPRIERPSLVAANTPSICQRSCTAYAVTGEPLLSTAEADPCFCSKLSQWTMVLEVLIDKP